MSSSNTNIDLQQPSDGFGNAPYILGQDDNVDNAIADIHGAGNGTLPKDILAALVAKKMVHKLEFMDGSAFRTAPAKILLSGTATDMYTAFQADGFVIATADADGKSSIKHTVGVAASMVNCTYIFDADSLFTGFQFSVTASRLRTLPDTGFKAYVSDIKHTDGERGTQSSGMTNVDDDGRSAFHGQAVYECISTDQTLHTQQVRVTTGENNVQLQKTVQDSDNVNVGSNVAAASLETVAAGVRSQMSDYTTDFHISTVGDFETRDLLQVEQQFTKGTRTLTLNTDPATYPRNTDASITGVSMSATPASMVMTVGQATNDSVGGSASIDFTNLDAALGGTIAGYQYTLPTSDTTFTTANGDVVSLFRPDSYWWNGKNLRDDRAFRSLDNNDTITDNGDGTTTIISTRNITEDIRTLVWVYPNVTHANGPYNWAIGDYMLFVFATSSSGVKNHWTTLEVVHRAQHTIIAQGVPRTNVAGYLVRLMDTSRTDDDEFKIPRGYPFAVYQSPASNAEATIRDYDFSSLPGNSFPTSVGPFTKDYQDPDGKNGDYNYVFVGDSSNDGNNQGDYQFTPSVTAFYAPYSDDGTVGSASVTFVDHFPLSHTTGLLELTLSGTTNTTLTLTSASANDAAAGKFLPGYDVYHNDATTKIGTIASVNIVENASGADTVQITLTAAYDAGGDAYVSDTPIKIQMPDYSVQIMDTAYTYRSGGSKLEFLTLIKDNPPSGTTAELDGNVITFTASEVPGSFYFTVNDNSGYYLVASHTDDEKFYETTAATNKTIELSLGDGNTTNYSVSTTYNTSSSSANNAESTTIAEVVENLRAKIVAENLAILDNAGTKIDDNDQKKLILKRANGESVAERLVGWTPSLSPNTNTEITMPSFTDGTDASNETYTIQASNVDDDNFEVADTVTSLEVVYGHGSGADASTPSELVAHIAGVGIFEIDKMVSAVASDTDDSSKCVFTGRANGRDFQMKVSGSNDGTLLQFNGAASLKTTDAGATAGTYSYHEFTNAGFNTFKAGDTVTLSAFSTDTSLNITDASVLADGLSATKFRIQYPDDRYLIGTSMDGQGEDPQYKNTTEATVSLTLTVGDSTSAASSDVPLHGSDVSNVATALATAIGNITDFANYASAVVAESGTVVLKFLEPDAGDTKDLTVVLTDVRTSIASQSTTDPVSETMILTFASNHGILAGDIVKITEASSNPNSTSYLTVAQILGNKVHIDSTDATPEGTGSGKIGTVTIGNVFQVTGPTSSGVNAGNLSIADHASLELTTLSEFSSTNTASMRDVVTETLLVDGETNLVDGDAVRQIASDVSQSVLATGKYTATGTYIDQVDGHFEFGSGDNGFQLQRYNSSTSEWEDVAISGDSQYGDILTRQGPTLTNATVDIFQHLDGTQMRDRSANTTRLFESGQYYVLNTTPEVLQGTLTNATDFGWNDPTQFYSLVFQAGSLAVVSGTNATQSDVKDGNVEFALTSPYYNFANNDLGEATIAVSTLALTMSDHSATAVSFGYIDTQSSSNNTRELVGEVQKANAASDDYSIDWFVGNDPQGQQIYTSSTLPMQFVIGGIDYGQVVVEQADSKGKIQITITFDQNIFLLNDSDTFTFTLKLTPTGAAEGQAAEPLYKVFQFNHFRRPYGMHSDIDYAERNTFRAFHDTSTPILCGVSMLGETYSATTDFYVASRAQADIVDIPGLTWTYVSTVGSEGYTASIDLQDANKLAQVQQNGRTGADIESALRAMSGAHASDATFTVPIAVDFLNRSIQGGYTNYDGSSQTFHDSSMSSLMSRDARDPSDVKIFDLEVTVSATSIGLRIKTDSTSQESLNQESSDYDIGSDARHPFGTDDIVNKITQFVSVSGLTMNAGNLASSSGALGSGGLSSGKNFKLLADADNAAVTLESGTTQSQINGKTVLNVTGDVQLENPLTIAAGTHVVFATGATLNGVMVVNGTQELPVTFGHVNDSIDDIKTNKREGRWGSVTFKAGSSVEGAVFIGGGGSSAAGTVILEAGSDILLKNVAIFNSAGTVPISGTGRVQHIYAGNNAAAVSDNVNLQDPDGYRSVTVERNTYNSSGFTTSAEYEDFETWKNGGGSSRYTTTDMGSDDSLAITQVTIDPSREGDVYRIPHTTIRSSNIVLNVDQVLWQASLLNGNVSYPTRAIITKVELVNPSIYELGADGRFSSSASGADAFTLASWFAVVNRVDMHVSYTPPGSYGIDTHNADKGAGAFLFYRQSLAGGINALRVNMGKDRVATTGLCVRPVSLYNVANMDLKIDPIESLKFAKSAALTDDVDNKIGTLKQGSNALTLRNGSLPAGVFAFFEYGPVGRVTRDLATGEVRLTRTADELVERVSVTFSNSQPGSFPTDVAPGTTVSIEYTEDDRARLYTLAADTNPFRVVLKGEYDAASKTLPSSAALAECTQLVIDGPVMLRSGAALAVPANCDVVLLERDRGNPTVGGIVEIDVDRVNITGGPLENNATYFDVALKVGTDDKLAKAKIVTDGSGEIASIEVTEFGSGYAVDDVLTMSIDTVTLTYTLQANDVADVYGSDLSGIITNGGTLSFGAGCIVRGDQDYTLERGNDARVLGLVVGDTGAGTITKRLYVNRELIELGALDSAVSTSGGGFFVPCRGDSASASATEGLSSENKLTGDKRMTDAKRCPASLASTYAENDVLLVDTDVTVTGSLTLVPGAVLRTHQSLAEKLLAGAGTSKTITVNGGTFDASGFDASDCVRIDGLALACSNNPSIKLQYAQIQLNNTGIVFDTDDADSVCDHLTITGTDPAIGANALTFGTALDGRATPLEARAIKMERASIVINTNNLLLQDIDCLKAFADSSNAPIHLATYGPIVRNVRLNDIASEGYVAKGDSACRLSRENGVFFADAEAGLIDTVAFENDLVFYRSREADERDGSVAFDPIARLCVEYYASGKDDYALHNADLEYWHVSLTGGQETSAIAMYKTLTDEDVSGTQLIERSRLYQDEYFFRLGYTFEKDVDQKTVLDGSSSIKQTFYGHGVLNGEVLTRVNGVLTKSVITDGPEPYPDRTLSVDTEKCTFEGTIKNNATWEFVTEPTALVTNVLTSSSVAPTGIDTVVVRPRNDGVTYAPLPALQMNISEVTAIDGAGNRRIMIAAGTTASITASLTGTATHPYTIQSSWGRLDRGGIDLTIDNYIDHVAIHGNTKTLNLTYAAGPVALLRTIGNGAALKSGNSGDIKVYVEGCTGDAFVSKHDSLISTDARLEAVDYGGALCSGHPLIGDGGQVYAETRAVPRTSATVQVLDNSTADLVEAPYQAFFAPSSHANAVTNSRLAQWWKRPQVFTQGEALGVESASADTVFGLVHSTSTPSADSANTTQAAALDLSGWYTLTKSTGLVAHYANGISQTTLATEADPPKSGSAEVSDQTSKRTTRTAGAALGSRLKGDKVLLPDDDKLTLTGDDDFESVAYQFTVDNALINANPFLLPPNDDTDIDHAYFPGRKNIPKGTYVFTRLAYTYSNVSTVRAPGIYGPAPRAVEVFGSVTHTVQVGDQPSLTIQVYDGTSQSLVNASDPRERLLLRTELNDGTIKGIAQVSITQDSSLGGGGTVVYANEDSAVDDRYQITKSGSNYYIAPIVNSKFTAGPYDDEVRVVVKDDAMDGVDNGLTVMGTMLAEDNNTSLGAKTLTIKSVEELPALNMQANVSNAKFEKEIVEGMPRFTHKVAREAYWNLPTEVRTVKVEFGADASTRPLADHAQCTITNAIDPITVDTDSLGANFIGAYSFVLDESNETDDVAGDVKLDGSTKTEYGVGGDQILQGVTTISTNVLVIGNTVTVKGNLDLKCDQILFRTGGKLIVEELLTTANRAKNGDNTKPLLVRHIDDHTLQGCSGEFEGIELTSTSVTHSLKNILIVGGKKQLVTAKSIGGSGIHDNIRLINAKDTALTLKESADATRVYIRGANVGVHMMDGNHTLSKCRMEDVLNTALKIDDSVILTCTDVWLNTPSQPRNTDQYTLMGNGSIADAAGLTLAADMRAVGTSVTYTANQPGTASSHAATNNLDTAVPLVNANQGSGSERMQSLTDMGYIPDKGIESSIQFGYKEAYDYYFDALGGTPSYAETTTQQTVIYRIVTEEKMQDLYWSNNQIVIDVDNLDTSNEKVNSNYPTTVSEAAYIFGADVNRDAAGGQPTDLAIQESSGLTDWDKELKNITSNMSGDGVRFCRLRALATPPNVATGTASETYSMYTTLALYNGTPQFNIFKSGSGTEPFDAQNHHTWLFAGSGVTAGKMQRLTFATFPSGVEYDMEVTQDSNSATGRVYAFDATAKTVLVGEVSGNFNTTGTVSFNATDSGKVPSKVEADNRLITQVTATRASKTFTFTGTTAANEGKLFIDSGSGYVEISRGQDAMNNANWIGSWLRDKGRNLVDGFLFEYGDTYPNSTLTVQGKADGSSFTYYMDQALVEASDETAVGVANAVTVDNGASAEGGSKMTFQQDGTIKSQGVSDPKVLEYTMQNEMFLPQYDAFPFGIVENRSIAGVASFGNTRTDITSDTRYLDFDGATKVNGGVLTITQKDTFADIDSSDATPDLFDLSFTMGAAMNNPPKNMTEEVHIDNAVAGSKVRGGVRADVHPTYTSAQVADASDGRSYSYPVGSSDVLAVANKDATIASLDLVPALPSSYATNYINPILDHVPGVGATIDSNYGDGAKVDGYVLELADSVDSEVGMQIKRVGAKDTLQTRNVTSTTATPLSVQYKQRFGAGEADVEFVFDCQYFPQILIDAAAGTVAGTPFVCDGVGHLKTADARSAEAIAGQIGNADLVTTLKKQASYIGNYGVTAMVELTHIDGFQDAHDSSPKLVELPDTCPSDYSTGTFQVVTKEVTDDHGVEAGFEAKVVTSSCLTVSGLDGTYSVPQANARIDGMSHSTHVLQKGSETLLRVGDTLTDGDGTGSGVVTGLVLNGSGSTLQIEMETGSSLTAFGSIESLKKGEEVLFTDGSDDITISAHNDYYIDSASPLSVGTVVLFANTSNDAGSYGCVKVHSYDGSGVLTFHVADVASQKETVPTPAVDKKCIYTIIDGADIDNYTGKGSFRSAHGDGKMVVEGSGAKSLVLLGLKSNGVNTAGSYIFRGRKYLLWYRPANESGKFQNRVVFIDTGVIQNQSYALGRTTTVGDLTLAESNGIETEIKAGYTTQPYETVSLKKVNVDTDSSSDALPPQNYGQGTLTRKSDLSGMFLVSGDETTEHGMPFVQHESYASGFAAELKRDALYDVTVSGADLTFSHRLPIEKNDKIVLTGVTGSVASISSMVNINGGFTVASLNGVVTITRDGSGTQTAAGAARKLTFDVALDSVGGMHILNNTGTIIREIAARIN